MEHRLLGNITEAHPVQYDIPVRRRIREVAPGVRVLLRTVQQDAYVLHGPLRTLEGLVMGQDLRLVLVHPLLVGGEVVDAGVRHPALADHAGPEQGDGDFSDGGIQSVGKHL